MLLNRISNIPLVAPLVWFRWSAHKSAGFKFAILWTLSVLPLVFTALTAPNDPDQGLSGALSSFANSILKEFNQTSLFVYAISFLVPILYLAFERFKDYREYGFSRKQAPDSIDMPPGILLVLVAAIFVFILTVFVYGRSGEDDTVLGALFAYGLVYWVYFYAVYCWYLRLLIEELEKHGADVLQERKEEGKALAKKLTDRVQGGK